MSKLKSVTVGHDNGTSLPEAVLSLALGPFAALTYDPGGYKAEVTLDDGRVGRATNCSTEEQAIAQARADALNR